MQCKQSSVCLPYLTVLREGASFHMQPIYYDYDYDYDYDAGKQGEK